MEHVSLLTVIILFIKKAQKRKKKFSQFSINSDKKGKKTVSLKVAALRHTDALRVWLPNPDTAQLAGEHVPLRPSSYKMPLLPLSFRPLTPLPAPSFPHLVIK